MVTREEVKDALNAIIDDEVREHQRRWVNNRRIFDPISPREFPIPIPEEIQAKLTSELNVKTYAAGVKRGMVRRGLPLPIVTEILTMPEIDTRKPKPARAAAKAEALRPEAEPEVKPEARMAAPAKKAVRARRATKARVTPADVPVSSEDPEGYTAPGKDPRLTEAQKKALKRQMWDEAFHSFPDGSGKQMICARRYIFHSFWNDTPAEEGLQMARQEAEAMHAGLDEKISA